MPLSALTLPTASRLPWGQAQYLSEPMFQVNPLAQFTASNYAARDFVLAYRDLLVAASVAQVVTKAADVWQATLPFLQLDGFPGGTIATGPDLPSVFASPGSVPHVTSSSVAYAAVAADQGLYARDALLYNTLYNLGAVFASNPLPPTTAMPSTLNDTWSVAEAPATPVGATVASGYPLNVSLFKTPDTDLASRDNLCATYVAQLELAFANLFPISNRLYIQAITTSGVGLPPESYNLISDNGVTRTWAAYPLMPGHLELKYNYATQTVTWTDEEVSPSPGPVPANQSFLTPTGDLVSLVNSIPIDQGPNFYRQKSSRIVVRPWQDQVVFMTNNPAFYVLGGTTIYQTSAILLTQPGPVSIAIPALIRGGYNRVSLMIKPDTNFSILGFNNVNGVSNGTAATLKLPGGLLWSATIPVGPVYFTVTFTDLTGPTSVFPVLVLYNGFLIFDGSWAFGQAAGVPVTTQPVQFTSTGAPANFEIVWTAGAGQLTINSINFSSTPQTSQYTLSAQLNNNASQLLTFQAIPGRPDIVSLDLILSADTPVPNLNINWTGGNGMCMYIYAFDVVTFSGAQVVENYLQYEQHKVKLMNLALNSVQKAYRQVIRNATATSTSVEFRTPSTQYGWVWDYNANFQWITSLNNVLGGQLTQAFKLAGPSDIGRPALVPAGLVQQEEGVAQATSSLSTPVLDTLQAWMLFFAPYVAGPDFWPTSTRAGTTQTVLPVTASFDYILLGNILGQPSVLNVSSATYVNGAAVNQPAYTVWTYANSGPSGGISQQQIILTAWLGYLLQGTIYTLTVYYTSTDLFGNVTSSSTSVSVTATGTTMSYSFPELTANTGCKVVVNSVQIS